MKNFALALTSLTLAAGIAHAEIQSVSIAEPVVAPQRIEVTVVGGPRLPANAYTLRDSTEARSTAERALSVRTFADGNDPIALAIVYDGQEVWLGNDTFEPEDSQSRFVGALPGLARALDSIADMRYPSGSECALISYSDHVDVRVPLTSISRLNGRALGIQLEYRGKVGTDLVVGIEQGLSQLERSRASIKALIVIGDGNDTNNEAAKPALADLRRRAARDGIQTFAVTYKGELSDPGQVITSMIPATRTVNSFESMSAVLDSYLERLTDRTYVTFSGANVAWDGREHALVIQAGDEVLDPEFVQLPLERTHTPWYRTSWWQQLGAGIGAVLLLALFLRLRYSPVTRAE